jgi:membrane protease YdiL (CAAX protease family)
MRWKWTDTSTSPAPEAAARPAEDRVPFTSSAVADRGSKSPEAVLPQQDSSCSLIEAGLWTLGYLLAQAVLLVLFFSVLLLSAFGLHWPEIDVIERWVLSIELDRSFLLVGVPVLGMLFVVLPAVRWREGREFRRQIGWRVPTLDETIIALATVCPVALIGNLVYQVAREPALFHHSFAPMAGVVRKTSLDHLQASFEGVPYLVLVISMALAPAVVEELVFRGVIGRRLVGRFGVILGTLMAATCFAAVHGSLPHALATLPVGIVLQLVYLQTGTIWLPVLVHFCNNLLAISAIHFHLDQNQPTSTALLVSLFIYLVMMLVWLQYRSPHAGLAARRCSTSISN